MRSAIPGRGTARAGPVNFYYALNPVSSIAHEPNGAVRLLLFPSTTRCRSPSAARLRASRSRARLPFRRRRAPRGATGMPPSSPQSFRMDTLNPPRSGSAQLHTFQCTTALFSVHRQQAERPSSRGDARDPFHPTRPIARFARRDAVMHRHAHPSSPRSGRAGQGRGRLRHRLPEGCTRTSASVSRNGRAFASLFAGRTARRIDAFGFESREANRAGALLASPRPGHQPSVLVAGIAFETRRVIRDSLSGASCSGPVEAGACASPA